MLIGTAESDVTPPLGTPLAGYFQERIADGIISPLMAKAIVLGPPSEKCALIVCDLLTMTEEISSKAREIISRNSDIPAQRIMICATHTHTGPELRFGRQIRCNEEYLRELPERIAKAALQADSRQQEAICCLGAEKEEGLAFNRRFRLADGREQFGISDSIETLAAAGPIDPTFGTIVFKKTLESPPFAILCNYSLHIDVTGGNRISADYPAVMTETLRKVYGPELFVLYIQGACGNINHVPYRQNNPYPVKGLWKSGQIGRALAGKALCLSEKALPSHSEKTDLCSEILQVPKFPKHDPVLQLRLAQAKEQEKPNFFEQRLIELAPNYEDSGYSSREVQTLRIGDAAICAAPGEYFVEWGLEIKKWSPAEYTFIAELCNDSAGYIPTYEAFLRGGYEATPVVSVTSTPALGQMIADANFRNLRKLFANNK
ncbi:MAG: hypothetical protein WCT05_04540 [Lentisphaeria bacterium]